MTAASRSACVLAFSATATALCLSLLAGWQRGGTWPERLMWIAIGMVLVTSAHLLPSLIRDASLRVRVVGGLLWAACLATACYGHAVFFIFAQQHAGERRASAISVAPLRSPARGLTAVMAERATVTAQLAAANARYCIGNCATLDARRVTLTARLDALNAEASDARRIEAAHDRVMTRRDALLADPVTSRLAALFGTTTARLDLLAGLMFAAILEGVACLLWWVVLPSSLVSATASVATGTASPDVPPVTTVTDMTLSVGASVSSNRAQDADSCNSDTPVTRQPDAPSRDDEVARLARDISAGLVRPTVADIRLHLGCSQAKALALRRRLAELDLPA
ncbi:hypothetical protein [Burkholderia cepacia]|uniref:hypothetical protein n=1 Tax=Burkholderia cepacia TaxID=292 RepID=UPI00158D3D73|nr:hypothetical protein [Burkholderia cepacia]HDR8993800.1 hypothetical protein [Burkholderia vietnamiensis]